MKWGIRRYQYADGSLTPLGRSHYYGTNSFDDLIRSTVSSITTRDTKLGETVMDDFISKGTTLSRIQATDKLDKQYAFFATYKKSDVDMYTGLFGKNLVNRANAAARHAERKAANSDDAALKEEAAKAREYADKLAVYKLDIKSTDKIKIPSTENAADITGKLCKDSTFKENLSFSISDSKSKMRRPQQQELFAKAESILNKTGELSSKDKKILYKALNLTLTNHNEAENRLQDQFYAELKKKGYSAIVDINDQQFSSYHAKRPVIVFDAAKVDLQAATHMSNDEIDSLYSVENAKRIARDVPNQVMTAVKSYSNATVSQARNYVQRNTNQWLNK